MPDFAEPLARLISEFKRLPGIGQKSAQRIAFHVLRTTAMTPNACRRRCSMSKINSASARICNNISDCRTVPVLPRYHRATSRVICVVEEPHNILPIETTRQFHGLYHVLHGSISPLARHRARAA